ncbi:MAG: thioesterase domain-containing protein [Marinobacter sp.]
MTQLARFLKHIHESIPLTRALGLEVLSYDGHALLVSAPLEPNHNHQGTGFGGSVYSVAVTAAWGLVELAIADMGLKGNVMVQSGSMDYLMPVEGDFYALCRLPAGEIPARFRKSLARHGKARIALHTDVYCGEPTTDPKGAPVATFQGRFVVQDASSRPIL